MQGDQRNFVLDIPSSLRATIGVDSKNNSTTGELGHMPG